MDGRTDKTSDGPIRAAIKQSIFDADLLQVDVAKAAHVHPVTLSLYLNGHVDCKGSTLERLLAVLHIRVTVPWSGDADGDSTASRAAP